VLFTKFRSHVLPVVCSLPVKLYYCLISGHAVAQWLRHSATNRKLGDRFPMVLLEFSIAIILPVHYGRGVDSVCNRNEYQEYFLGIKAAGA
jgi:hypothetical protein